MKMEKRRFVDLLLKGELEAVTQGLEDGLFSWEELDQPHDDQGFTPLMSACQMGLHKVRGKSAVLKQKYLVINQNFTYLV